MTHIPNRKVCLPLDSVKRLNRDSALFQNTDDRLKKTPVNNNSYKCTEIWWKTSKVHKSQLCRVIIKALCTDVLLQASVCTKDQNYTEHWWFMHDSKQYSKCTKSKTDISFMNTKTWQDTTHIKLAPFFLCMMNKCKSKQQYQNATPNFFWNLPTTKKRVLLTICFDTSEEFAAPDQPAHQLLIITQNHTFFHASIIFYFY